MRMKWLAPLAVIILLQQIPGYDAMAEEPDPTMVIEEEIKGLIAGVRREEPAATPDWVRAIPDRLVDILKEKHYCADGPVWGLARGNPDDERPYDPVGTSVFLGLVKKYDLYDEIGGYNEDARLKALRFWQKWQDPETGRFRDPEHPEEKINEKYLVGLIHVLGGELLYPWTTTGTEKRIETTPFLELAREHEDWALGGWEAGSKSCFMAVEIWDAINKGQTELIPDLEEGLTLVFSHMNPEDGFCGPKSAELWRRLGGNLKIVGRVYFKMGLPVPYSRPMVDTIIENTRNGYWFEAGEKPEDLGNNPCVPRNIAEVTAYCLETTDYRREELLDVMDRFVEEYRRWVLPDGTLLRERDNAASAGLQPATLYGLGILGAYLHWEDCPIPNPLLGKTRGIGDSFRAELLPGGRVRIAEAIQRAGP